MLASIRQAVLMSFCHEDCDMSQQLGFLSYYKEQCCLCPHKIGSMTDK
jgi:hypothetical protein